MWALKLNSICNSSFRSGVVGLFQYYSCIVVSQTAMILPNIYCFNLHLTLNLTNRKIVANI